MTDKQTPTFFRRFRIIYILIVFLFFPIPLLVRGQSGGELLYNSIVLPAVWPPQNQTFSTTPVQPPYLSSPPPVIRIDVGRQLFVDNFLISNTTLNRTFHSPDFYAGNPVLSPDQPWEEDIYNSQHIPMAIPYSDGVWYDDADGLYKMWYYAGGYQAGNTKTALATSADGITWTKTNYDVHPGTNIVFEDPIHPRDSGSIIIDYHETDSQKRYKMFRTYRVSSSDVNSWVTAYHYSADGIHWSAQVATSGFNGDRSSVSYDPFRHKWIFSLRYYDYPNSTRVRRYWETNSPETGPYWSAVDEPVRWVQADTLDTAYPGQTFTPQLYAFDTFPYESVTIGLFSILRGQPSERPRLNEVYFGASRDGYYFDRTSRTPFIGVSEAQSTTSVPWNWGNVQSAGGPLIVGDQLYFYVSGRTGEIGMTNMGTTSTGLATLRRDGFASMDAGSSPGTLTTRLMRFTEGHDLYVNLGGQNSTLSVEVFNEANIAIPGFTGTVQGDHTKAKVTWSDPTKSFDELVNTGIILKFTLQDGSLYSFWVGKDNEGASGGFAGNGPLETILPYVPPPTGTTTPPDQSGAGFFSFIIGGTSATSSLSLQSTSGTGISDFIRFLVGDNGATEAMRIARNGYIGIGTSLPTRPLHVVYSTDSQGGFYETSHETIESSMTVSNDVASDANSEWHGIQSHLGLTGSQSILRGGGGSSDIISSIRGYGNYTGTATLGSLAGVSARVDHEGHGIIDNLFSFVGEVLVNNGGGTINNYYGLFVPRSIHNASTIINTYGVYVGNLHSSPVWGGTQVKTPYSFYASDPDSLNYFAGNVGVGTTTPADKLSVAGPIFLANSSPTTTANRLYSTGGELFWSGSPVGSGGGGGGAGPWSTDGVNTWRLTGKVGVGTSSPYAPLSVAGLIAGDSLNIGGGRFTVKESGNLGIGTSNPKSSLQISAVKPSIVLTDTAAGLNSKNWFISSDGGTLSIGTTSDAQTSTSTYFRIGTNGGVAMNGLPPDPRYALMAKAYAGVAFTATGAGGVAYSASAANSGYGFRTDDASIGYYYGNTTGLAIYIPNNVRSIFRGTMSIGTVNNPDARLEIVDPSQAQLRLTHTDNTVFTDLRVMSTGNLYINSSGGKVGIGTSSPSSTLSVQAAGDATTTVEIGKNSTSTKGSCLQMYSPNGTKYRVYIGNSGILTGELGPCQ